MNENENCQLCGGENNLIKDHDIGLVCKECNDTVIKDAEKALFDNGMKRMEIEGIKNRLKMFEAGPEWWENS